MKNIIAKRRKELNLTQEQLANKLNVSSKLVSKWETGRSLPDTSILVSLARELDISLDELLGNNKNETKEDNENNQLIYKKYNYIVTCKCFLAFLELFFLILHIFSNSINESNSGSPIIFICFFITFIFVDLFMFLFFKNYFNKNGMFYDLKIFKVDYYKITAITSYILGIIIVFTIDKIDGVIILLLLTIIWLIIYLISYIKK